MNYITYIVSALKGEALCWSYTYLHRWPNNSLTFSTFLEDFLTVFDHPLQQEKAVQKLSPDVKIKRKTASDFAIHFRIIAEESRCGEKAIKEVFINNLNKQIKDQLATRDVPMKLDSLATLAIRINNRVCECFWKRTTASMSTPYLEVFVHHL